MQEHWLPTQDFPGYSVSSLGRVRNDQTDHILAMRRNHQGVTMVGMMLDGRQHTRSVAVLVATAFLDDPGTDIFDTPIHLDGDRTNLEASNLAWRPRWFAVKFHRQFRVPAWYNFSVYIVNSETGEKFTSPREVAVKYGLLERDIVFDLDNQHGVYPGPHHFHRGDQISINT